MSKYEKCDIVIVERQIYKALLIVLQCFTWMTEFFNREIVIIYVNSLHVCVFHCIVCEESVLDF